VGGDAENRRAEARPRPLDSGPSADSGVGTDGRPGGRIVRVVPDVAAVAKTFDYSVPEALDSGVRVGTQVRIPLGGRRVAGWVVAEGTEAPVGVALKALAGVRGWGPPAAVVSLASWAAWRWAGPVSSFLGTASAPVAVRGLPPAPPSVPPALGTGVGTGVGTTSALVPPRIPSPG
jgi:primosomal protein N' (replication factor Y) (superfamily II helicase)